MQANSLPLVKAPTFDVGSEGLAYFSSVLILHVKWAEL